MRAFFIGAALIQVLAFATPACAETFTDLRGVSVGMLAADLPKAGYRGFACEGDGGKTLAGWSEWKMCTPGPSGLRGVHVAYDDPGAEETIVAGHPVVLTLSFDGDSRLARIVIETDPHARLYLRKKAHLLSQQAKQRYGETGWECRSLGATEGEAPIGFTLIKEECSKSLVGRTVTTRRSLLRRAGSDLKDFVSESRIDIVWRR